MILLLVFTLAAGYLTYSMLAKPVCVRGPVLAKISVVFWGGLVGFLVFVIFTMTVFIFLPKETERFVFSKVKLVNLNDMSVLYFLEERPDSAWTSEWGKINIIPTKSIIYDEERTFVIRIVKRPKFKDANQTCLWILPRFVLEDCMKMEDSWEIHTSKGV